MKGNIYFEIQADEPQRAVNFYKEVFGWEFTKDENIPIEYWRLNTKGSGGAILKRPTKTPPTQFGTNAFVCSFEVANFDATAKKVQDLGGLVALPKFAIPSKCWQGYFMDTEHNTFGIFEADETAK